MESKFSTHTAALKCKMKVFPKAFLSFLKSNWFTADKGFLELRAFWVPTLLILVVAAIMFKKISSASNLTWCWDSDCLNTLVIAFQVPLATLALLIPVLGLFNANHKSEQTRVSMELSKSQNNFANYYKHLDEFEKYVDKISKVHLILFNGYSVDSRSLYPVLYPNGHLGDPTLDQSSGNILSNHLDTIVKKYLEQVGSNRFYKSSLFEIEECKEAVFAHFKRSVHDRETVEFKDDDESVVKSTPIIYGLKIGFFKGDRVGIHFDTILNAFKRYHIILKFDASYDGTVFDSCVQHYFRDAVTYELENTQQSRYANLE